MRRRRAFVDRLELLALFIADGVDSESAGKSLERAA